MNILGITITGVVAFSLILIALFGLLSRGALGSTIRGMFGRYSKLILAVILVVGLASGGIAYGQTLFCSFSTASIAGATATQSSAAGVQGLNCEWAGTQVDNAISGDGAPRADPNDLKHYYMD